MIPSFNKTFNKKPGTERKIPKAVLDYLNSTVPEGTRYVADKKGNITLIADGKPLSLSGFTVKMPSKYREQAKSFTTDELYKFAYNAQIRLDVKLDKEGCIVVNGQEMPLESLHKNIFDKIKYIGADCVLIPSAFPKPKNITIASDEFSRQLKLKRVPYASLSEIKFESDDDQPLKIQMLIDEKNRQNNFSISYNLGYASTVKEIVETISIFNAVADGQGYLMGEKLSIESGISESDKFDNQTLTFWKEVLALEDALELEFKPPKGVPDVETICIVERLYQNLILKKPIRENRKITSISSEWKSSQVSEISDSIGKPMYFQYTGDLAFNIFGRKFVCPSIFGMFNCKLVDIKVTDGKTTLTFEDESEEVKGYTSVLSFASKKELDAYGHKAENNHADDLKNSKSIKYISNE